jgi:hypothetical protein
LTWTPLPVASRIVACGRPFSFYFGLIEPLWRTSASVDLPIHRLTTLARKQGARTLVVEDASSMPSVRAEIGALDKHHGGGGAAEALKLSFLRCDLVDDHVTPSEADVIGQCVVVNYRAPGSIEFVSSFVLEALFALPRLGNDLPLLNNFISRTGLFQVMILDWAIPISCVSYAQQNSITSVCAHACLYMVERTLFPDRDPSLSCAVSGVIGDDAIEGMLPGEMAQALRDRTGQQVSEISCEGLTPAEYVSILTAATESGDIALLVFKTGAVADAVGQTRPTNHVVVVLGHTRNSDEWHPQAIPEYSGLPSAPYCPASSWVDHFLIHDDNFGPYFTLSSRALESDPTVRAEAILVVRDYECTIEAHTAEAAAATFLSIMLPTLSPEITGNPWLDLVTRRRDAFVTRPILISRRQYVDHLRSLVSHDGSTVTQASLTSLEELPEHFWMVEYTIPDLLAGNRTKLGEVLLEATWNDAVESNRSLMVRGMRAPSRLLIANSTSTPPSMSVRPFPLASHGDIYVGRPHPHQW